jgi:hypothetical protein
MTGISKKTVARLAVEIGDTRKQMMQIMFPYEAAAHQRKIRELLILQEPHKVADSLDRYSIETISRHDAIPLITRYEWLGNMGRASLFVGLFSPARELNGVACFGHGPQGKIRELIGSPALCLERGACVHYAPRNAASFLINHACKLAYRLTGTARYFAYADPMAGEYGGVYQAAGWIYLGQGLDGGKGRARRFFVLPVGKDPGNPANWRSTRDLRREDRRLTFDQARALGWRIAMREAKHVYAKNIGPDRRNWYKTLRSLPYPAPRPELKLTQQDSHS